MSGSSISTVTRLPLTVSCFLGMAKTSRFLERAAFGVTAVPPYRAFAMAPLRRAGRALLEPFQNSLRGNPFPPRDDCVMNDRGPGLTQIAFGPFVRGAMQQIHAMS